MLGGTAGQRGARKRKQEQNREESYHRLYRMNGVTCAMRS